MSADADIAMIGLGVMGRNLARNMASRGRHVAVFDRAPGLAAQMAGEKQIVPTGTPGEMIAALKRPRAVMMMVPAGAAVDEQLEALLPQLEAGDALIDGGNSHFRDTIRRTDRAASRGVDFLGLGISGGESGARHGPSIMAGGPKTAWERLGCLFTDIAARHNGEACCAWLGGGGAGHFVKTMHNGIEYADMQVIAEVYGVLRDGLGWTAADAARLFAGWQNGPLASYLVEITAAILAAQEPDGRPTVETILDRAAQKGTGQWASVASLEIGVAAPTLAEAVAARLVSAAKPERERTASGLGQAARTHAGDKAALTGDLADAFLGARIAIYAQGFAVIAAARGTFGWKELALADVARVWQGGCIIRARLLDDLRAGFAGAPAESNLLLLPAVAAALTRVEPGWRRVVAAGAMQGWPMPVLASSLAWLDGMRTPRSAANLIQAQRDFFGAHTVERVDAPGTSVHLQWPQSGEKNGAGG
jgi:6-phosphogluconate dehydrogenase